MRQQLPKDLATAEQDMYKSISSYIATNESNRISLSLKFEGLRIMPVAFRLYEKLNQDNFDVLLCWPDAGGAALARNNYQDIKDSIFTFKEATQKIKEYRSKLIVAISPKYFDYEEFESLCTSHENFVIMLNGNLEDPMIGIGSVARSRRKSFLLSWHNVYSLEPLSKGALMKTYPSDWALFILCEEGYRFLNSFDNKPSQEEIFESMNNF